MAASLLISEMRERSPSRQGRITIGVMTSFFDPDGNEVSLLEMPQG